MTVRLQDGLSPEWTCPTCLREEPVRAPKAPTPLRGILLREEGDTLIVKASEQDVRVFGAQAGRPLTVQHGPAVMSYEDAMARIRGEDPLAVFPGDYLYNESGVRVMLVSSVDIRNDVVEATVLGDLTRTYRPTLRRYSIQGEGIR
jgi:hypothetical protein